VKRYIYKQKPYENDKELAKDGRLLYIRNCKSCHGSNGRGDGPAAAALKTFPGDFTTSEFKNQAPGVLYYKSIIGRDEMPNYEKKISDEKDQWAVIMYMLTFE